MREIIFRGKDRTGIMNHLWQEGSLDNTNEEFPKIVRLDRWGNKMLIDVAPETVGQYTGLIDKSFKKIFEGDIVKCRHHWRLQTYPNDGIDAEQYFYDQKIRGAYGKHKEENPNWMGDDYYYFRNYVVEYYAPNGGYRVRNGGQFHALTSSYISNRDLEIIGNIHDNPGLLKGE